ncbi:protein LONGIFOLIA 2-like [Vigna unguiculata]|uniref:protein LONGIFOLIA 2-like n=1 Tax=Vigna unguiculata TaxID=3917 RepID=UPI001015CF25|nr:protein LONGIFOLIA 2-like [Vigna unguiculata]XP_027921194.1 protein LONGIFOLIA 2-like [Vigna unguiculata]XP_027921195.1 protein LONGIFOLIA 2-like [Vigna unguiculata]XP_027921196.1 protein LONGIFOLIA 2-like [Vigna unguiculata]
MAAKFLHSLADDNPDLKKQIGCMTGIFQLFDRHHIISSPHITRKRLHPGNSLFNYASLERGSNIIHQPQSTADMRDMSNKHKISAESSRTSFSSCSSSMSSLDYKAEADAPFERIGFPETPMRDPVMNQASTSPHLGCSSLDLRDVVKECIYREARGLCKERDYPRQFQLSKSVDRKQTPIDLKESLRVLAILRETPRHYVEAKELPRLSNEVKDGHWHSISKDAPRFSYDGRATSEISFDSNDTLKCQQKLKELPRLSLDSREGSWRANGSDSKLSNLSRNFNAGDSSTSVDGISSLQQRSASQRRPPSIVAKLMGLEALPESYVVSDTKSSLSETDSTQGNDQFGKNGFVTPLPVANFPEVPLKEKEMTSPRWKNPDLVVKPILNTRFPIEPAPWKQQDGNQISEKLTSRVIKPTSRTPDSFPSVYSEIENRLKDLEFKQSGRDLRALKQILETMQVKGLLETRKEEQASNVVRNKRDYELKSTSIKHSTRQETAWESDSTMAVESPIVIMKPAKIVEKTGPFASSVFPIHELSDSHKLQSGGVHEHGKKGIPSSQIAKDQSPRNSPKDTSTSFSEKKANSIKTIKSTQSLPRSTQFPKENGPSSVKSSRSASPRMQQKKSASEKQSCLLTPSSDSNNPRRQFCKQTTDSDSPSQKLRPKVPNSHSSNDRLSETSNELRSLSSQWDEVSLQSDSISFDSKMDIEVTSNLQSAEVVDSQCPSRKAAEHLVSGSMHKKSTMRWDEDKSIAELTTHASGHPSLGSVVDVSVYKFGMPSPVKDISYSRKVENAQESKENYHTDQWSPAEGLFINNTRYREINHKKLQSIGHLIQKLRQLNSSHDETRIDYIASLCENTNSDHRYIAEILLASGLLLRALSSELLTFQHHSSGHPINPELFLVLEQTKLSSLLSKQGGSDEKVAYGKLNTEKWHRKLIFDTVNEILGTKLGSSREPWFKPSGLTRKFVTAQKLLKELCFEIQKLKYVKPDCKDEGDDMKSMLGEDVMRHSENWTSFPGELPGVVLDVERQIFKDLIDEFVIDECLRVTYSRHSKLFGK